MAEIIASAHDAHKSTYVHTADALGYDVAIGLGGRQFDIDGLVPLLSLGYEVGEREIGIRACHQVCMMIAEQVFFNPFSHASEHSDDEPAPFLSFCIQGVEAVVYLLLGIVSHRACVEEYGIGRFK